MNDLLLIALTAKRSISWRTYKDMLDNAIAVLDPGLLEQHWTENAKTLRYQILRSLYDLGHIDYAFNRGKGKIWVTKACACIIPTAGEVQALLIGARSSNTYPSLLSVSKRLSRITLNIESPSSLPLLPSRITVSASSIELLKDYCQAAHLQINSDHASWALANMAGTTSDYLETLSWHTLEATTDQAEVYSAELFRFSKSNSQNESCMYTLSKHLDSRRNREYFLMWHSGQCAEVDLDWGRIIALNARKVNFLKYDKRRFRLSHPIGMQLPKPYSRALVLCSGILPSRVEIKVERDESELSIVYHLVPPQLAELISSKLDQILVSTEIFLNNLDNA